MQYRKKIVSFVLVFTLIFSGIPISVFAAEAKVNDTYEENFHFFSEGDGTCSVYCTNEQIAGEIRIPEMSPDGDTVTAIADYAFCECALLTGVIIPKGVKSIGDYAFYGCVSLVGVAVPDSVTSIGDYAFCGCGLLTGIAIPGGVKSIGDCAFYECSSLARITLPAGVESIGDYAFYYCSSLDSITLPVGLKSIGDYAFCGCSSAASISLPGGLTSIGDYVFCYCNSITSVVIPGSLKNIGYLAFGWCGSLASVTISRGVKSIGDNAFFQCSSLTSISVPEGVESIGDYAFCECSSITSIKLPDSLISIGDYAFYHCASITDIAIPDGVTSIGNSTFAYCFSLTDASLPKSAKSIGDGAFCGCNLLTNITLPDGVTRIGDDAFYYCFSLTEITLPAALRSIGDSAFCGCDLLTSITLPEGVESIGDYAFFECGSITSIKIPHSVKSIGQSAFSGCDLLFYAVNNSDLKIEYDGTDVTGITENTVITLEGSGDYHLRNNNYTYSNDGFLWEIGSSGNTLLGYFGDNPTVVLPLTYQGNRYDISFHGYLKHLVIPEGMTGIPDRAFINCQDLESVILPKTLKNIGLCSFYGCTKLKSVENHSALYLRPGLQYYGYIAYYADTVTDDNGKVLRRVRELDFDTAIARLLYGIEGNDNLSEMEKALLIHDRLIQNTEYACSQLLADALDELAYSGSGAIYYHWAVCSGYGAVYSYLMNRLGIRTDYISSRELNHGWNIITLDGERYYVDCTWDDPVFDGYGYVSHSNFLIPYDTLCETGHTASDFDTDVTADTYKDAVFRDKLSAFCIYDGNIYYFNKNGYICQLKDGAEITVYHPASSMNYGDQTLTSNCEGLFYNDSTHIYKYVPGKEAVAVYTAEEGIGIRGFKFLDGLLCIETEYGIDHGYFDVEYFASDISKHRIDPEEGTYCLDCGAKVSNHEHSYSEPVYIWKGTQCTATIICTQDGNHIQTETATGVYVKDTNATCQNNETGHYEAEFTNPAFEKQFTAENGVEIANSALGHVYDNICDARCDICGHTRTVPAHERDEHGVCIHCGYSGNVMLGDPDGDGRITVSDALIALRVAAKLVEPTPELLATCDIDKDGSISVTDALAILRVAAKLTDGF